ncbi:MAG: hypothetical protein ACM3PY_19065, partial [Omnitrophica WOR_2 bacterium]
CYDAPIAPHLVDWYWQPQSLAYTPPQVRLIFDRAGLSKKDQPIQFPGRPAAAEITERPDHFVSYFWMMHMISAKHAFRSPWSEQMEFLPQLTQSMVQAQKYLDQEEIPLLRNPPFSRSPGEKLLLLNQFAGEMRKIMAVLSERGEDVPVIVTPGIDRYLNLVDLALEDKKQDH